MSMIVEVEDQSPGNIVEGALDQFEITGQLINSVPNTIGSESINAYPNPFSNNITINYTLANYSNSIKLIVRDILGKTILEKSGLAGKGNVQIGAELPSGIYMIELTDGINRMTQKVVKQ